VKAAVAGVAVTGLVAGIAADHPQLRRHDAPLPAAPEQRHLTRTQQQEVDAPQASFGHESPPRVSQPVTARKAEPKHVSVTRRRAPRHVVVAPAAPSRAAAPRPAASSAPPVPAAESAPEAPQGRAHEQQPAKPKPAEKLHSPRSAARPAKPDPEPKSDEAEDPGSPAEQGPPADPGSHGEANGKNK
jgi:hypothetical protein